MNWRYKLGLLLIVVVEITFITTSEINQGILTKYPHPFAVTYLGVSLLASNLLLSFAMKWLKKHSKLGFSRPKDGKSAETTDDFNPYRSLVPADDSDREQQRSSSKLSNKETAKLALLIGPFWFLSEYLENAAVQRTSVASATMLFSTSSIFTLWIGIFLKEESLNLVNVVSVIVSMAGVFMTAFAAESSTHNNSATATSMNGGNSFLGEILALLYAMVDAVFNVLLKRYAGEGENLDMQELFGYIGLFTLASLWCLVWPLSALGLEPKFKFPQNGELKVLIANCSVGSSLCGYLWGVGIAWTTPLVAAIGSSLTIPLAMMEDMLIHGQHYSLLNVVGSVMVLLGFGIANVSKWFSTEMRSNFLNSISAVV